MFTYFFVVFLSFSRELVLCKPIKNEVLINYFQNYQFFFPNMTFVKDLSENCKKTVNDVNYFSTKCKLVRFNLIM